MRTVGIVLGSLIVVLLAAGGLAYYAAGKAAPPVIAINQPSIVGQSGTLDVTVDVPGGRLDEFAIDVAQAGQTFPVVSQKNAAAQSNVADAAIVHDGPDRLHVTKPIGRQALPALRSGRAQIVVHARRPVLFGLRSISSDASKDIDVRLEPPQLAVLSTFHYVNVGGTEMVVYRATPPDVESGVRVGTRTYPGFPASGAGLTGDPNLKVAFFALLYDEAPTTTIEMYAKDSVGNEASTPLDHRIFPKTFRHSTIPIDDTFLNAVVPPILQQSPDFKAPADDRLAAFLRINNDMRHLDDEKIAALASNTAPAILWHGAFRPLGGAQVESAFADYRTYVYGGKAIDHQVHLGFDLAKTVHSPVFAANDGKVIYAADLGIYGNCIIIDHGMGVQSLYGHLSMFQVHTGDLVAEGQQIGVSGRTGIAGGDHLHFSMLVNGHFVNATEWWDPHWIEDRVTRKLVEAGAPAAQPSAAASEQQHRPTPVRKPRHR